ncbi:hypothetical protein ANN_27294 [Periplaneta americana]|uniref:guanylate cyclase n=1 Tax=Periplaneta americana TaxID=6978 RepID=A0ABQ8RY70_PERAM|nr:hypothetical protein ANN_27294 [Periplaneta americana]
MNKDDPDRRIEYCEWFENILREDVEFPGNTVCSDEAQFKLNGTVNRYNCVSCPSENPHIHQDKAVNLPGLNVWYDLSFRAKYFIQTVASKLHGTEVEVEILKKKEDCDHVQFLITELSGPGKVCRTEISEIETLCKEPKVSPATFCRVFPFHLMFDRELRVVQTGCTVARVIPRVTRPGCRITDILDMVTFCMGF